MKLRLNDTVTVLAGKDKGKTGAIVRFAGADRVVVEGLNKQVRHIKGRDGNPGQRAEIFASMHVSNVAVIDPKTKKATRIGYKVSEAGGKVRIAKASGTELTGKATAKPEEAKTTPKKTKTAKAAPKAAAVSQSSSESNT